jgi:hypothetical protein
VLSGGLGIAAATSFLAANAAGRAWQGEGTALACRKVAATPAPRAAGIEIPIVGLFIPLLTVAIMIMVIRPLDLYSGIGPWR